MSEQFLLHYNINPGSTKEREVVEGPYSLDEVLKRRLEVSEAGFRNWKVEGPKK